MRAFTVVLDPDEEEGGYTVTVPALPGCITQGETLDEALAMARDAIEGYLASMTAHDERIPVDPVAEELADMGTVRRPFRQQTDGAPAGTGELPHAVELAVVTVEGGGVAVAS